MRIKLKQSDLSKQLSINLLQRLALIHLIPELVSLQLKTIFNVLVSSALSSIEQDLKFQECF